MRNPTLLVLLATLALGAPYAAAQTAPTPTKPRATVADVDKQTEQMQENVKRMQQQMDGIHETKDPTVRHKLLDEHAETMKENMEMLRGMGGPTMTDTMRERPAGGMESGMGLGTAGASGRSGDPMAGMDPKQQVEFMQRRMDMMQMMMEQILRHQLMMQAQPEK